MLLKKQVDGLSPQERKQRERREILNAISCRFPQFTEEICFTVLSDAHWMIPDAIQILLRMNRKRRINLLKQDYPDLSESVIRSALVPSDPENLQTREKLDKFIADQISTEEKDSEHCLNLQAQKIEKELESLQKANQQRTLDKLSETIRFVADPNGREELGNTTNPSGPVSADKVGALLDSVVLTVDKKSLAEGEKVVVSFTHKGKPTANDWIGMYCEEDLDRYYRTYQWVDLKTNQCTFVVPSVPCRVNFRYFHDQTYTCYGVSSVVLVGYGI
eukprot:TRINITY_DN571_c0_g1_i14.p1 TRINITY_DN571_c0_g1~~TRINITY_DN571_c0_g1_i14.p1  ORF type:complete len:275 (+),score=52.78 TRINITY_DN571_c0_g1_i14:430-1254(+)